MGEHSRESLTEYGETTGHTDTFVLCFTTSSSIKEGGMKTPHHVEMLLVHPYPPLSLQQEFVTRVQSHKPEIVLPQTPFQ